MKEFLIISHTHWDREWYFPFEQFRMRLCDLINNLLDIIKEYPEYIFHLDSQTIVLEDYIEIYPENEEFLKECIKKGNIIIGPWYVQNDFFLSSGEATIRNLFIGKRVAECFGGCANVGYTADQFGLISQLPQILNKMGIHTHLFGRGYSFYKDGNSECKKPVDSNFYWESPDGSRVFSVLMPYWYNNLQRVPEEIGYATEKLNNAEKNLTHWSDAPYFLMMNGVDHLEAQEDLLPIVEKLNKVLVDRKIVQTTMEDVMKKLEPFASENVVKGELRYGTEWDLLTGSYSTRVDIKKLNYDMQNMIEHKIEPLYSMISLLGAEDKYPQNEINYMWKKLIPNHAHDSICCCSNNNVMKHMQDRYMSLGEIAEELLNRGSSFINHHIERTEEDAGKYYLTVINTSQVNYTGVIDVTIDINIEEDIGGLKIVSPNGDIVPIEIIDKERTWHATFSPINLPGNVEVMNYKLQVYVEDVPSFGYANYTIIPSAYAEQEKRPHILDNEYLKVDFNSNKINLKDKINDIYYKDILNFEDVGDSGTSYIFMPFENDLPIKAELVNIETVYANSLKSEVCLTYTINVPSGKNEVKRSGEVVSNKLFVTLSLGKGEKALAVNVKNENNSKYHLLRAVINTGIENDFTYASSVYDVIKRDRKAVDNRIRNHTQPVNGFVYKKSDKYGVAIYTQGLYEYENEEAEFIKLSLLRSTDTITMNSDSRKWGNSDNLMLGTTEVRFSIMPFGENTKHIPAYEQNVSYQPVYWCDSTDVKMFTGGRPAVQDGDVDKVYFRDDKYSYLKLPHKSQILEVSDDVCVTALKKAEKKDDIIIRMYNSQESQVKNVIRTTWDFVKTDMLEKSEECFNNTVGAKEIVSLIF